MTHLHDINEQKSYFYARDFFIRILGCIYFVAFTSMWSQVFGLIGEDGIIPVQNFLDSISQTVGLKRFFFIPTVFWLNASDIMLHLVCGFGVIGSVVLCIGLMPAWILALLYVLYLSIVTVGGIFLSFQWDILLLECGFLAIFLCPWTRRLERTHQPPNKIVILLFHLLLFKLMFQSGLVKIMSGDIVWADYTALTYHYWSQPLPNPLSWMFHHLPDSFHKLCVVIMFIVEIIIPWGIFISRRTRLWSCWLLMYLQVMIILTGNYGFFNLLAIALCVLLIDDSFFLKHLKWLRFLKIRISLDRELHKEVGYWCKRVLMSVAVVLVLGMTVFQIVRMTPLRKSIPQPVLNAVRMVAPYGINNSYGLFAMMTKIRPEIILEGSMDKVNWVSYKYAFKPGVLYRRPVQVAPHMPRLDWQLWFAALHGNYQNAPWVLSLIKQLLEGSDSVERLFKKLPFDSPPKYIRANVYLYEFTNPKERYDSGNFWTRTYDGVFAPPLSLEDFQSRNP